MRHSSPQFLGHRLAQPCSFASPLLQARPIHHYIHLAHRRFDIDRPVGGGLGHYLFAGLRFFRDGQHEITQKISAAHANRRSRTPNSVAQAPSAGSTGVRCEASEVTPCLGKLPCSTITWHLPHVCRPPQIDSSSTPRLRAASRRLLPRETCPRRPEGSKTS